MARPNNRPKPDLDDDCSGLEGEIRPCSTTTTVDKPPHPQSRRGMELAVGRLRRETDAKEAAHTAHLASLARDEADIQAERAEADRAARAARAKLLPAGLVPPDRDPAWLDLSRRKAELEDAAHDLESRIDEALRRAGEDPGVSEGWVHALVNGLKFAARPLEDIRDLRVKLKNTREAIRRIDQLMQARSRELAVIADNLVADLVISADEEMLDMLCKLAENRRNQRDFILAMREAGFRDSAYRLLGISADTGRGLIHVEGDTLADPNTIKLIEASIRKAGWMRNGHKKA